MKIEFDSKPVHGDDDKYIKTKIKTYGANVNTNLQDRKVPKEKVPCNCLSIILLVKIENFIDDNLEKSLSGKEADNDCNDEMESDYQSNE